MCSRGLYYPKGKAKYNTRIEILKKNANNPLVFAKGKNNLATSDPFEKVVFPVS